jgi:asparagine synthetase B (glutamine-hydrolysing)
VILARPGLDKVNREWTFPRLHRRLAIIDLPNGVQPMCVESKK